MRRTLTLCLLALAALNLVQPARADWWTNTDDHPRLIAPGTWYFSINVPVQPVGQLQFVNALPADFKEQPAAADLHVTPDGRFLYGSERKTSTLAGYRIDPEKGSLTPIGHFPTEKTPRGFNIDPRGRFLLSVGLDSNAMTVYQIDQQSGALTSVKQYPMGQQPNWIEIVDLR